MGIQGLLPFLSKASREVNIRNFSGCTVAVDTYCWLHKGAFSCADKLGKGEKTDGYVHYCVKMVNVLLEANVTPILVFDGRHLPAKSITEIKRRENKLKYKAKAKENLIKGNLREARECFQRCVEITPQMALETIQACRKLGIDCIVAPYEADAQLAFLNKSGIAQVVITEDSDLVLFGCERIVYKMDANGKGTLLERNKIHYSLGVEAGKFTFEKFRHMCILAGCDYLQSLPGIGLGKACRFFMKTTNPDLNAILPKIPSYLRMPMVQVTSEYIDGFVRANNTFLYQLVFDPLQRKLVPLNHYPDDLNPDTLDYAGRRMPDDDAFQIAIGNINVETMQKVGDFDPDKLEPRSGSWSSRCQHSIWSRKYSARPPVDDEAKSATSNGTTRTARLRTWNTSVATPARQLKRPLLNETTAGGEDLPIHDLITQYGLPKKCKLDDFQMSPDDEFNDTLRETPPPAKVVHCSYFQTPAETNNDEHPPPYNSPSVNLDPKHDELDSLALSQQPGNGDVPPTPKRVNKFALPSDLNVNEVTFDENWLSKTKSCRGQLVFDDAVRRSTSTLAVPVIRRKSEMTKSPMPSKLPRTGSFDGKWHSLRNFFQYRSTRDEEIFAKSPSSHTIFKSVVNVSQEDLENTSLESDLPSCSSDDDDAASSLTDSQNAVAKMDLQNSPSGVCEDNERIELSTKVLQPCSTNGQPPRDKRINVSTCRQFGLSRRRRCVQDKTQLSLKESLARFSYRKT